MSFPTTGQTSYGALVKAYIDDADTASVASAATAAAAAYGPKGDDSATTWSGFTRTHATSQYIIRGIDSTLGLLIAYDSTNGALRVSSDNGTTWSNAKGHSTMNLNTLSRIQEFSGNLYTIALDTSDSTYKVWTTASSTGNTAYSWSTVLSMTSGYNTGVYTIPAVANGYMFVADYGDPTGGPAIWRTPDGSTWTKTYTNDATLRHAHAVAGDPFNPGTVYATMGDGVGTKSILKSTDDGANWTAVAPSTGGWQAVAMGFTSDYIWFGADQNGGTAWVCDRTLVSGALVPKWASRTWHHHVPVPGAQPRNGGSYFSDGVSTSGSKTYTSATAAFTSRDKGRRIAGTNIVPGAYISAYVNATTVTLSDNATASGTALDFALDGAKFYSNAYQGAVDTTTGTWYCGTMTGSTYGITHGLFRVRPGGSADLLFLPPEGRIAVGQYAGNSEVFIYTYSGASYLAWDRYVAPLAALAAI